MRLIDADELKRQFNRAIYTQNEVLYLIDKAETKSADKKCEENDGTVEVR